MSPKLLWAPWRKVYVGGERVEGCVFCHAAANRDDPASLVVHTGEQVMVIMNRYPYTSGHLMITPLRHVGGMEELTEGESRELWTLAVKSKAALDGVLAPDGYNLGLNLGEAAGAGITDHLHLHVVPRWKGDSNFMPVLGDVRVMPVHMEEIFAELKRGFSR